MTVSGTVQSPVAAANPDVVADLEVKLRRWRAQHPVGGTGLFQIAETYLQITQRFPNPAAQVRGAKIGLAHSIGGPGNNVYVTLLEATGSRRQRSVGPPPRLQFEPRFEPATRQENSGLGTQFQSRS